MSGRLLNGARWLSASFMATREEAHRELGPMLTEGLVSKGYALLTPDGRMAVSDAGRRMLAAEEVADAGVA